MGAVSVSSRGGSAPFPAKASRSAFESFVDAVRAVVPTDATVLITTMPRGGLQVCRTLHVADTAVRRYGTEGHRTDRLAWHTLQHGITAADDVDPAVLTSGLTAGLALGLALRVEGPVFGGYPGVLMLLRRVPAPRMAIDAPAVAGDARALFDRFFQTRPDGSPRQFVFSENRQMFPAERPESLVGRGIETLARDALKNAHTPGTRQTVVDEHGVRAAVQIVRFDDYPALGGGPVVFASIHPRVEDWDALRPDDFSADPEVGRMADAVRFITTNFRRGPTLDEVADAVHLSQFHFHRRFSDLFGLTPKHLLYDLQLDEARRLLADPRQPLASIAKHCGFAHQSHFTSRFKQGTGLTPTRWRRQATEAVMA